MTKYGIGYTIFKFEGERKIPIVMEKVCPGNLDREVEKLKKRLHSATKNVKLYSWVFLFGFVYRIFLEIVK